MPVIRSSAARQQLGWSQSDLAAKLQLENVIVEQKAVSRMELGERLVADYELLALAKVLKVSIMWLLTGEEQPRRRSLRKPAAS